jgi:hypothetical protein
MNTGRSQKAKACVLRFRALGLRPRPGMTGISENMLRGGLEDARR